MLEDRLEGAPAQPGQGPATWNWALFDAVYAQALAIGVRPVWTGTPPAGRRRAPNPNQVNPVSGSRSASTPTRRRRSRSAIRNQPRSRSGSSPTPPSSGGAGGPTTFSKLVGDAAAAIRDRNRRRRLLRRALARPGGRRPTGDGHVPLPRPRRGRDRESRRDRLSRRHRRAVQARPRPHQGLSGRMRSMSRSIDSELPDAPIAITQLYSTAGRAPTPTTSRPRRSSPATRSCAGSRTSRSSWSAGCSTTATSRRCRGSAS